MTIQVVIADDQALVRKGFRMLLESESDIEVVGEAEDGRQAVDMTRHRGVDVVLMDIQMPNVDGIEATRRVIADPQSQARVLILTTFERDEYVFQALGAGASGFLLKNAPPEELIQAVRIVAAGDALLAPSVTRRVIAEFAGEHRLRPQPEKVAHLTQREIDVLRLLARGSSNSEIAEALFLSEATIKSHMSRLLSKLGLRDRVQAVIFAYQNGLT